ncbi:thiosulfate sulfurtransferase Rdl2p, mitochondrial [Trichomonascus vanleenenianus]|uniref:rhodanese-like domain-containing protein n=1 Tax=Trichomonascus vanleenenianus TaxID=2268995 RepID=UPI003ECA39CD
MFRVSVVNATRIAARRGFATSPIRAIPRVASSVVPRVRPTLVTRRWYSPLTQDAPAEEVDYNEVKKLSQSNDKNVVIIDVREPEEYAGGHIPNAVNIPFKSCPGALGLDAEEFAETFGFDKPTLDQKLVFYCLAGIRSSAAESLAATYGYQNRLNYKGSYEDWVNHEQKN